LVSRLDPSNLQIPARRKTAGNCSVSQKKINLCTNLRRKACHEGLSQTNLRKIASFYRFGSCSIFFHTHTQINQDELCFRRFVAEKTNPREDLKNINIVILCFLQEQDEISQIQDNLIVKNRIFLPLSQKKQILVKKKEEMNRPRG
jgi:hypothetical protein